MFNFFPGKIYSCTDKYQRRLLRDRDHTHQLSKLDTWTSPFSALLLVSCLPLNQPTHQILSAPLSTLSNPVGESWLLCSRSHFSQADYCLFWFPSLHSLFQTTVTLRQQCVPLLTYLNGFMLFIVQSSHPSKRDQVYAYLLLWRHFIHIWSLTTFHDLGLL